MYLPPTEPVRHRFSNSVSPLEKPWQIQCKDDTQFINRHYYTGRAGLQDPEIAQPGKAGGAAGKNQISPGRLIDIFHLFATSFHQNQHTAACCAR